MPAEWPSDVLRQEVRLATQSLGIASDQVRVLDFEVRDFAQRRQDVLQTLIDIRDEFRPNLVLVPSSKDVHQDHSTVHLEAMRAFKTTTIYGYELPWNNFHFDLSVFVALEQRHVEAKVAALQCYESQRGRVYFEEEFTRSQAKFRGTQIGRPFAEVFEVYRLVED